MSPVQVNAMSSIQKDKPKTVSKTIFLKITNIFYAAKLFAKLQAQDKINLISSLLEGEKDQDSRSIKKYANRSFIIHNYET